MLVTRFMVRLSAACCTAFLILTFSVALGASADTAAETAQGEALLEATQRQETARVRQLLENGADVNFKSRYGATALFFACDKGNLELVKLLLDQGADINVQDTFYQAMPLGWALSNIDEGGAYRDIVLLLLEKGADNAGRALPYGVRTGDLELVQAAVKTGKVEGAEFTQALLQAQEADAQEIAAFLRDKAPAEEHQEVRTLTPEEKQRYIGDFTNEQLGMGVKIFVEGEDLKAQATGQPALSLDSIADNAFRAREVPDIELTFEGRGGLLETFVLAQGGQEFVFLRAQPEAESAGSAQETGKLAQADGQAPAGAAADEEPVKRSPAMNWPSFRGPNASGIGDGQGAPLEWDGETGDNIRWKTPIPGIALSSPVVWGDRIFVTTAVSKDGDSTFRTGLYGDVDSVDDDSIHQWKVYALDKASGQILWERQAAQGSPKVKRHLKSSHANPTAATDGKHLVAHFGSEGLFCYDFEGNLLWSKDLGILSSGWFYDASYEWGFSSSPILYAGKVIVQTDIQKGSFLAAFDVGTGKELWRTARDEIPTWGTPSILPAATAGQPDEIVTNGTTVRGYDAATGKELWTLSPNSEVTVGSPVVADGVAYVTGGYPPARPIYAILPGGRGDLSASDGAKASEHLLWSVNPGGTYIPTPIAYRGILYMLNNNGRLAAYDAKTGERIYQERVGQADGFSGSPVAADGRLYITSEEGSTYVVKAGKEFALLKTNSLGEVVMTTPAISDGLLILRSMNHVYGIGLPRTGDDEEAPATASR